MNLRTKDLQATIPPLFKADTATPVLTKLLTARCRADYRR